MTAQTIDCRGQECPAPILAIARAARRLGAHGGEISILADDDAFPLDLRSWCQSTGSELLRMNAVDGAHHAVVRVAQKMQGVPNGLVTGRFAAQNSTGAHRLGSSEASASAVPSRIPPAPPVPTNGRISLQAPHDARNSEPTPEEETRAVSDIVDCRGMECPRPILEVARAARKKGKGTLTVFADDDAFELDVQSWCRSSQADLVSISREGRVYRAVIRIGRGDPTARTSASPPARYGAPQQNGFGSYPTQISEELSIPPEPTSPVRALASSAPLAASTPPIVGAHADLMTTLDLSVYAPEDRIEELDRFVRKTRIERVRVLAPDRSFNQDLIAWCAPSRHVLESLTGDAPVVAELRLNRTAEPDRSGAHMVVGSSSSAIVLNQTQRRATILVLHNDKEALLAALLVANGAAAQGMEVVLYFTFWGLNLLRGERPNASQPREKVTWAQRMFKWLMPRGPRRQSLSKLNFGGMGSTMMASLMKSQGIMDLPELLESAEGQGVRFIACTMSMKVMGVTKRDLHPYPNLEYGGVAAFVESARTSEMSLVF